MNDEHLDEEMPIAPWPKIEGQHVLNVAPQTNPRLAVTRTLVEPEPNESQLEELMANEGFLIEIPRTCLLADVIQKKLVTTPRGQRVPELKKLMKEFQIARVILLHPLYRTMELVYQVSSRKGQGRHSAER